ncbi:hypothetical protein NDU88_005163 [Pleurodeles waltl]|uniref:Uncharacterized protein n=1 Tax=Pleurodeles waltl TaxID=8319 RepID=A0AAV7MA72_PLEWA|nr:hypothetical protein NDU88_005163 [Pleurodeles waltl]
MMESSAEGRQPCPRGSEGATQESDIRAMFLDLKHRLTVINTKTDLVTGRFNHLKKMVDGHGDHFTQVESRTSVIKDSRVTMSEKILQMENI